MPRKAQPNMPDEDGGAPEWMVTFSDCMTLLLTFFVLLLSFSSFDDKVFLEMQSVISERLPSIGLQFRSNHEALQSAPRIFYQEDQQIGSKTPTVDGQYQSNPNTSMDFMNFQNQKIFLVTSDKVFLGLGMRMSRHGRQMLTDVGELLKAVPNRIVVTEHPLDSAKAGDQIGLTRAWIITQFLTESRGLEKTRFSISSTGTMNDDTLRQSGLLASNPNAKRVLEIVILERSTCN